MSENAENSSQSLEIIFPDEYRTGFIAGRITGHLQLQYTPNLKEAFQTAKAEDTEYNSQPCKLIKIAISEDDARSQNVLSGRASQADNLSWLFKIVASGERGNPMPVRYEQSQSPQGGIVHRLISPDLIGD